MIFAVDPGNEYSAFALLDEKLKPIKFGKVRNMDMYGIMLMAPASEFVIEMVACYGMPVGKEVFETCVWIGRFWSEAKEAGFHNLAKIYRKDEKMNLCHTMKAKDANIRQALIDRFGPVGTKKAPGWFYGVSNDVWAAVAVGVTYADMRKAAN